MVSFCTSSSSALQHSSSYQKASCTGSQLSAHMSPDGDAGGMWLYQLHAKQMTYTDHLWQLLDSLNYPQSSPYLHVSITSLSYRWNHALWKGGMHVPWWYDLPLWTNHVDPSSSVTTTPECGSPWPKLPPDDPRGRLQHACCTDWYTDSEHQLHMKRNTIVREYCMVISEH